MTSTVHGGNPLRRILDAPPPAPPDERCEMCGEPIPVEHSHLVDVKARSLMCACRGCALLFTNPGAAAGRFRPVPDRFLRDPDFAMSESDWDRLQIPVRLAFFLSNSELDRFVGFYPSPAGATECQLPMTDWEAGLGSSRLAALLQPDVEALLVRGDHGRFACYLVPVDACYRLVGLVRRSWKGFDGGTEAWEEIESFFQELDRRSDLP